MVSDVAVETVHTHKKTGDDHMFELCKCSRCGIVRRCTPSSDFLVRVEDMEDESVNGAPYYCEPCFLEVIEPVIFGLKLQYNLVGADNAIIG